MSDRTPPRIALGGLGLGAILTVSALAGGHPAAASDVARGSPVRSRVTNLATGQRLAAQAPQRWLPGRAPAGTTVVVDPTRRYQTMTGFGASMTDSAAFVLSRLPAASRDKTMADLFSPATGIGISMLRNPMGAADFAVNGSYSYDDQPAGAADPALADFSITHDQAYILPMLRQAERDNPQLAMMGTPWSPPGWMKTSGSMVTGSFLPQYYPAYARYFVKYLQGYAAAGVPVRYVSAQNEPLYEPATYPGMNFPAADEAAFIGTYLGPALRHAGLRTQILGYDHNWDVPDYPEQLYSDPAVAAYVPGTAWHCYAGDVSAQSVSHNDYPHAQSFETECSGGTWQGTDADAFAQTMGLLIGAPRNWAQSVILWNLALDDNRGPQNNGCDTCRGVVTVHADGSVTKELDYWALGQVTRFVHPGATRIASSQPSGISDVAYTSPDGTGVLVAYNPTASNSQFSIQVGDQHVTTTIAAGAAVTYRWAQPARLAPADPAALGSVDLDLGKGPSGTPTGRLEQTVSSNVLAGLNQVRLGNSWLAYSQPHGATVTSGPDTVLPRSAWTAIARGQGHTGIMTIPLPATTARYVRIVSEASSGSWWSIGELNIGVAAGHTSGDSGHLRTATATLADGPAGGPAQLTARYNAGNAAATVSFPLSGFGYTYRLPPTAAVTFATWPAS